MSNRAVLFSIRPKYADLIFSGVKKIELRRTKPKLERGDLALVYVSAPVKSLIGAFEVEGVLQGTPAELWKSHAMSTAVTRAEYDRYFAGAKTAYGIILKSCWKLKEPVPLDSLRKQEIGFRPPQSFRYLSASDVLRLVLAPPAEPRFTAKRLRRRPE